MRLPRLAALVSLFAGALALYACGDKDRETAPAVPSPSPITSRSEAPFDIVREGGDLVMTGDRPLRARFASAQTSIARKYDGAKVSFRAPRIGRGHAGGTQPPIAEPERVGDRVQFARNDVTEWYEQTTNGIEQGFTIATRPAGAGGLHVDVAIGDEMAATAGTTPNTVVLRRRTDDTPCFEYRALAVNDANGHELEASMAPRDASTIRIRVDDANAAYPITIDPLIWALQTKLKRIDGVGNDQLGNGVAIQGNTAVLGMIGRKTFRGGVLVVRRTGAAWQQGEILEFPGTEGTPPDAGRGADMFGFNVALRGDRMLGGTVAQPALFREQGTKFVFERIFEPPYVPDPLICCWETALGQDRAAVVVRRAIGTLADAEAGTLAPPGTDSGLPTIVVVYRRDGATWVEEARLETPTRAYSGPGRIALEDDRLAVAADDATYVYRRSGTLWQLEASLAMGGTTAAATASLTLSGERLFSTRVDLSTQTESVSIHRRVGTTWSLEQQLLSPDPCCGFGSDLAAKGDLLFVGNTYFIYQKILRYRRDASKWLLEEVIPSPDLSGTFAHRGTMATTADTALFGDPSLGNGRGVVYVYALRGGLGEPCSDSLTCHSGHCVDGVCCDSACGGGLPNDCMVCDRADRRGTCSAAESTTICRSTRGECDVAETCDGKNVACPADTVAPNGRLCSGGSCIAGACVATPAAPIVSSNAAPREPSSSASCAFAPRRGDGTVLASVLAMGVVLAKRRRQRVKSSRRRVALLFSVLPCAILVSDASTSVDTPLVLRSGDGFLKVRVTPSMTRFADLASGASWGLALESAGRDGTSTPTEEARLVRRDDARVEVHRDRFVEWYQATEESIEHGFDIDRRPPGSGRLSIRLRPELGAAARMREGRVSLVRADGTRLAYGEIRTLDAHARLVPTSLDVKDGTIELSIDDRAAAYPLVVDPLVWRERQRITFPDLKPFASFGRSIAMDETRALVTQPNLGKDKDAQVHVFERSGALWHHSGELPLPKGVGCCISIALDGTRAAVGLPKTGGEYGSVQIFDLVGSTWVSAGAITNTNLTFYNFGWSVALKGNRVVASSLGPDETEGDLFRIGEAYVYERENGAWIERARLRPPDARFFGSSVSLEGNTIAVGATPESPAFPSPFPGAYVFELQGGAWNEVARISPPHPPSLFFGLRVELEGDTLAVAAPIQLADAASPGAVHIYRRVSGTFQHVQELHASDASSFDLFGYRIALHGERMLVSGATPVGAGAMYLLEGSGGLFKETRQFVEPLEAGEDAGGFMNGDFAGPYAIFGEELKDNTRGEIVTFFLGLQGEPCENGDKCASGLCVDGVCCDSACGDGDKTDCLACSIKEGGKVDGICGPATSAHVCRAKRGECDTADVCDGANVSCPADSFAPNGLVCGGGAGQCIGGACSAKTASPPDAGGANASPPSEGGGCSVAPARSDGSRALGALAIAMAVALRSRRKTLPRDSDMSRREHR